jgi:5-methylcytosine-specific restriction protein A
VRVIDSDVSPGLDENNHDFAVTESTPEYELHQAMLDNYNRAGRETGYWASYFLRELRQKGGLAIAQRMLVPSRSNVISKGLQALLDAGRIDLSVEATVLQSRFRSLFTDAELAEAQRLLDELPDYTRRRTTEPEENFPDEIDDDVEFTEGAIRHVTINAYERESAARAACIKKHGLRCSVCEMSFAERYGPMGAKFIHVHHKKPLAIRRGEYRIRPTIDLAPVCPNCHAMLHTQNPPLGIDELRTIIEQQKEARPFPL